MGLKIKRKEDFNAGIRRVILEEGQSALSYLREESDRHEAIHEVRKSFKKIRAAHRLIRDHSGFYKEENRFYRDQGRKLSELRDASSFLETLDGIKQRHHETLKPEAFQKLAEGLEERRREMTEQAFASKDLFKEMEEELSAQLKAFADKPIDVREFKDVAPSIRRVYERGQKMMDKAAKSGSPEDYHEWRKRAKYLRYVVQMVKNVWKPVFKNWESELHQLTNHLGEAHDLYNLKQVLKQEELPMKSYSERVLLYGIIGYSRKEQRRKALRLGKKIYALPPKHFVGLIGESWEAFRK